MIWIEAFEVALATLTAAGLIRGWRKDRPVVRRLEAENTKLFEMYTAMQERVDKLSATPPKPELDGDGNPLPPEWPLSKLNYLDDEECCFCKMVGKVTWKFCPFCTTLVNGVTHRMMYGHFHVCCGHCGANYFQREKKP